MPSTLKLNTLTPAGQNNERRNNELAAFLSGTGQQGSGENMTIRSITWIEETKQWAVVYVDSFQ